MTKEQIEEEASKKIMSNVILALLENGASKDEIHQIFENANCSDEEKEHLKNTFYPVIKEVINQIKTK